jgi:hypothetical protein
MKYSYWRKERVEHRKKKKQEIEPLAQRDKWKERKRWERGAGKGA